MGYEILATPFGKLEITAEPWLETRTMTFVTENEKYTL